MKMKSRLFLTTMACCVTALSSPLAAVAQDTLQPIKPQSGLQNGWPLQLPVLFIKRYAACPACEKAAADYNDTASQLARQGRLLDDIDDDLYDDEYDLDKIDATVERLSAM